MTFINAFLGMFEIFIGLSCFRLCLAVLCFFCGWFIVSEIVGYLMGVSEYDN